MFNINIDWQAVAENLRSEHLIELFMNCDPAELATNPWVIVPALCVIIALYFFHFRKLIAVLAGFVIMWVGFYYGMPFENEPLNLENVLMLGGTFVGVAAFWIYFFLIKGD